MSLIIKFIILLILPAICMAAETTGVPSEPVAGIGGVAQHMMEPVSLFADFVHSACFAIGTAFLFTAIIKYVEHRRSPLMVPISTVIFLVIAGIVLILLPFASYLTESGVHYSLMK